MVILNDFLQKGLRTFARDRAKTDRNSTSRLSPHIHFGEVSVRRIYYLVKQVPSPARSPSHPNWSCLPMGDASVLLAMQLHGTDLLWLMARC